MKLCLGLRHASLSGAIAALCCSMNAQAIELQPGSYTPAPTGSSVLDLTYAHLRRDALYKQGNKMPGEFLLEMDMVQLRGRHYLHDVSYNQSLGFSLYCGQTQGMRDIAYWGRRTGCADLLLGTTLWPLVDHKRQIYFGLTPYVTLPTGQYEAKQPFNLGENRWTIGLNTGYSRPINEHWQWEWMGDLQVYGENDAYLGSHTLKQEPLGSLQFHLRYNINKQGRVFVSYLHDWGGETSLDDKSQHNSRNNSRYRLGYAYRATPALLLQLSWGADIHVENGMREDQRLLLRSVWMF